MKLLNGSLWLSLALLWPSSASAHIVLLEPAPRSASDSLKAGPCGDVPRTSSGATYQPGQTITVRWTETVEHPGNFRISFSPANDEGFDDASQILADGIKDIPGEAPHQYEAQVKLPDVTCSACTLQLRQFMKGSARPYYYSCADLVLAVGGSDGGEAGGSDDGGGNSDRGGGGADGSGVYPDGDNGYQDRDTGYCQMALGSASSPGFGVWMTLLLFGVLLLRPAHKRNGIRR